jgi:hypothetical protein
VKESIAAAPSPATVASDLELTSCEKRGVARNFNADLPLIVFSRDNE